MNNTRPKVIQLHPQSIESAAKAIDQEASLSSANDTQVLLNSAKLQASNEIRFFRENAVKLLDFMADSVLFKDLEPPLRENMIDTYLDKMIVPIVAGNRPNGMDESDFKEYRSKLFLQIIKKYIKKENA